MYQCKKVKFSRKGKTYEEIYGKIKSEEIRKTLSKVHLGQKPTEKQMLVAKINWLGNKNPRWKPIGSKRMSHDYVLVKIGDNKWVKEEWLVAEKKIGRKLFRDEVVHHINMNKSDNRPENLNVMTKSDHKAFHTKDNVNKI
jgi:hypothetical protein